MALYQDHLEFLLPASKTDPFRQGVTILIAGASNKACLVATLYFLFSRFPALGDAPLFDIGTGFSR